MAKDPKRVDAAKRAAATRKENLATLKKKRRDAGKKSWETRRFNIWKKSNPSSTVGTAKK